MGIDKVKHFAVGSIIACVVTFLMYHFLHWIDLYEGDGISKAMVGFTQMSVVAAVATWKEEKDNIYDWWDWIATVIPSFILLLIIFLYF